MPIPAWRRVELYANDPAHAAHRRAINRASAKKRQRERRIAYAETSPFGLLPTFGELMEMLAVPTSEGSDVPTDDDAKR